MKLKLFVSAFILAGFVGGLWAANDPVLMTVNNKKVTLSEFEYLYKKNLEQQVNKESLDEYVDRFIVYKLKVAEAERLGYDTLPRIKSELNGYKNDMLAPFLTDSELQERLVTEAYDRMKREVNISHLMLARGKEKEEDDLQIAKMDSIRNCILNGEDFNDLVMKYSIDRSKVNNRGEYGFIGSGMLPYAFEYACYNTPVGEISKPFSTDYGIHMVRVNSTRPSDGRVEAAHILLLFPRGANDSLKLVLKNRIDSIYNCIKAGENFEDLAKRFSNDRATAANGGKLRPFARSEMVVPFNDIAFALKNGEVSEPFETQFGYHIVKKYDHKPLPSFEEARPSIEQKIKSDERSVMPAKSRTEQVMKDLNYIHNPKLRDYLLKELEKHGGYDSTFVTDVVAKSNFTMFSFDKTHNIPLSAMTRTLNPRAKYANNEICASAIDGNVENIARYEIMKYYSDNLVDLNPEYRNLMNEYRDGTLLFEVMNNEVWKKAKSDDKVLQQLFDQNRSKYQWDAPHFKGIMVCAKTDSILNEVKASMRQLSSLPEDTITTNLNKKFGHNIKMVRVISKQGENEMVDHIAFGGKLVESSYKGYPVYDTLFGKIIKQPEELSDVKGAVSSDYQDLLEQQWVDSLRKQYKVEVNKKVLNQLKKQYK